MVYWSVYLLSKRNDQLRKNILPKKDRINDFEIIRG